MGSSKVILNGIKPERASARFRRLFAQRSSFRKSFKRFFALMVLAPATLLISHSRAAAAAPPETVAAKGVLLIELDSGMVLYPTEKNDSRINARCPPDALTKVMTLLLAISACESGTADVSDVVVMTESAHYNIDSSSTTRRILPGEEMTLLDLMYCAYLGGANEACNLIAEHIGGSVEAFVQSMNLYAGELGCENTHYANANGLYSTNHYTTAMDQFVIFREALSHPLFVDISGTYSYTTEETNMFSPRALVSGNGLLNTGGKYYYRPCTSGMAPFIGLLTADVTPDGGYSCIAAAESDGISLVAVVLGADAVYMEDESVELRNLTQARRLFEWGYANFSERTILSSSELVGKAPIMHGAGADFVNLHPESSIELLLDNNIPDSDFERFITIYSVKNNEVRYAPVYVGDVLGEVVVKGRDGTQYGPILLVANTSIELNRLQFIRMRISEVLSGTLAKVIIWGVIIVVLGYIALVVRYNVLRRRRVQRTAEAKKRLMDERKSNDPD